MPYITTQLFRHKLLVLGVFLITLLVCFIQSPRSISADASKTGCSKLTTAATSVSQSYSFTATASGNSAAITGYRFDFGDHQSYVFAFDAAGPQQNRSTVTVTHAYASQGIYSAVVYVETHTGDKTDGVTSSGCHAVVTDGPTTLVNTGAGNTLALFAITSVSGLIMYQFWLRRLRTNTGLK